VTAQACYRMRGTTGCSVIMCSAVDFSVCVLQEQFLCSTFRQPVIVNTMICKVNIAVKPPLGSLSPRIKLGYTAEQLRSEAQDTLVYLIAVVFIQTVMKCRSRTEVLQPQTLSD